MVCNYTVVFNMPKNVNNCRYMKGTYVYIPMSIYVRKVTEIFS